MNGKITKFTYEIYSQKNITSIDTTDQTIVCKENNNFPKIPVEI